MSSPRTKPSSCEWKPVRWDNAAERYLALENLCEVTVALEGKHPLPHRGRAVGHPTPVSIISLEPHISPVFLPFTDWGSWRQVIGSESQSTT